MIEWLSQNYELLLGGGGVLALVGSVVGFIWKEYREARRSATRTPAPSAPSLGTGIQIGGDLEVGGSVVFFGSSQEPESDGVSVASSIVEPTAAELDRYAEESKPTIRAASDEEVVRYDPKLRRLVRVIQEHARRGDFALLALVYEAAQIPPAVWREAIPLMDEQEKEYLAVWVNFQSTKLDEVAGSLCEIYGIEDQHELEKALDALFDGIFDGLGQMDGGTLG